MLVRYLESALFLTWLVFSFVLEQPGLTDNSPAAENQISSLVSLLSLSASSYWAVAWLPTSSPQFSQRGLEGCVPWLQYLMKSWQHDMAASVIAVWWKKLKFQVTCDCDTSPCGSLGLTLYSAICKGRGGGGDDDLCARAQMPTLHRHRSPEN